MTYAWLDKLVGIVGLSAIGIALVLTGEKCPPELILASMTGIAALGGTILGAQQKVV